MIAEIRLVNKKIRCLNTLSSKLDIELEFALMQLSKCEDQLSNINSLRSMLVKELNNLEVFLQKINNAESIDVSLLEKSMQFFEAKEIELDKQNQNINRLQQKTELVKKEVIGFKLRKRLLEEKLGKSHYLKGGLVQKMMWQEIEDTIVTQIITKKLAQH